MFDLNTPVSRLGQLGKVLAPRVKRLGILTVADLIFYFPFRHEDFSNLLPISKITPGSSVTVKGRIDLIANRRSWAKRKILTEALVSDDTGSIKVIWFNQPFLTKVLKPGDRVFLSGRVDHDYQALQFISPIHEVIRSDEIKGIHTARIIPIYSLTESITQKQLRTLVKLALGAVKFVKDWLPTEIKKDLKLPSLPLALAQIHFPDNKFKLESAKHRLKLDELFLIQLQAKKLRRELEQSPAPKINFNEAAIREFVNRLPFKLTEAQRRSAWEIIKDLGRSSPMNRLLEGEVGSGKTVVAALALLDTVLNGYQAAFMAPTEILARQHFNNLSQLLAGQPVSIGLLTRSESRLNEASQGSDSVEREKLREAISSGQIQIIIGTQALIQERVRFENLALVIVDEQHRFGVEQRAKLVKRRTIGHSALVPHFLSMTATPIPRTLTLAFFGDLDLSIIDQLPAGRKKIVTRIIEPAEREQTNQFIRREIKEGKQAFVICPLIDPSDKLGVESVKSEYEKLSKKIFPDLKIGFLHGRLKAKEKERVMKEFSTNQINILVSTSVIEVGIDVPNAAIMVVEGAERFGLAQLHQFRGRVGRGGDQAYCFLFIENNNDSSEERVRALVETDNGFSLAEKDLELRGPGEVYGLRQAGLPRLKIATLTDRAIIEEARIQAEKIISSGPDLNNYPDLKIELANFTSLVHLE